MEKSDKKISTLVVLAAGHAEAEVIADWRRKVTQKPLADGLEIEVCDVSQLESEAASELSSVLAKADIVFIACGADTGCLPPLLQQQVEDQGLTPVVLLSRSEGLTQSDLSLARDKMSILRSDMPLDVMVEKLLAPLVGEPFINVDINDFKMIATPGSEGVLACAISSEEDAAFDATEQALIICRDAMAERSGSVNLLASLTGQEATFTVGDYSRAGEALEVFSGSTSTVIVSAGGSDSLSEGSYEAVVTMMKE